LQTHQVEQILTGHEESVWSVLMLNPQRIVSASKDRTLKVWNLQTGQVEHTLSGHEDSVNGVAVVDANRIVSASDDRTLKVWNLQTGQIIASVGLDGALTCVAVTRQNGRTLVVAGDAGGALYCLELVEPVGQ
jgi:WD40 repeat protein